MKNRCVVSIVVALCALAPFVAARRGAVDRARPRAYEQRAEAGQAQAAWTCSSRRRRRTAPTPHAGAGARVLLASIQAGASDDDKMALFQEASTSPNRRSRSSRRRRGHFWLGVLYGVYGEAKGSSVVAMVPDIKAEMATAARSTRRSRLGPDRVLGRMYYACRLQGGDNKKSLEHSSIAQGATTR